MIKDGNIIIINAAEVATPRGRSARSGASMAELEVISDGAVVVEGGTIARVGPTAQVMAELRDAGANLSTYDTIDAAGRAVLPGFVDSHTHLVFGGYRAEEYAWRLKGVSYMDILQRGGGILSTVRATRAASSEDLFALGRRRLDSMLAFGVTTVEGKSGYGLDRETEIRQLEVMAALDRAHPVDVVPTFMGAHAVPPEYKGRTDEFVDFLLAEVVPRSPGAGWPSSATSSASRVSSRSPSPGACSPALRLRASSPSCTPTRSCRSAAPSWRPRSERCRPTTSCTPPTRGCGAWRPRGSSPRSSPRPPSACASPTRAAAP